MEGSSSVEILDVTYATEKVVWRKPLKSQAVLTEEELAVLDMREVTEPGTRFGHTAHVVDNKVWCFGGSIDYRGLSVTYGDLWELRFGN